METTRAIHKWSLKEEDKVIIINIKRQLMTLRSNMKKEFLMIYNKSKLEFNQKISIGKINKIQIRKNHNN